MPKILFTGGGSAGHVTPNIALIKELQKSNWEINYAGSRTGIERTLIERLHIPYFSISTGKLRRQLNWRNLLTPFQVILGIIQAFFVCLHLKPDVVFSKGGFVAFPVVFSAWLHRIPVIIHESDLTPGLANRLSFPFAKKICVTFPEGKKFFRASEKVVVTGTPLRQELFQGDKQQGLKFCEFTAEKPVLLIIGGGLGSENINRIVRLSLKPLLEEFQIIHLCGKNKLDKNFSGISGYQQYEYINDELADLLAASDGVISRAGANSLYELLALRKPHLLIPLSKQASRGDQLLNADYFAKIGLSLVLLEENLNVDSFLQAVKNLYQQRDELNEKLTAYKLPNSNEMICRLINDSGNK